MTIRLQRLYLRLQESLKKQAFVRCVLALQAKPCASTKRLTVFARLVQVYPCSIHAVLVHWNRLTGW